MWQPLHPQGRVLTESHDYGAGDPRWTLTPGSQAAAELLMSRLTAVCVETKSVRSDSRHHCGFSVGAGRELRTVCPPAPGWPDCPEASPITWAGLGLRTPHSHTSVS